MVNYGLQTSNQRGLGLSDVLRGSGDLLSNIVLGIIKVIIWPFFRTNLLSPPGPPSRVKRFRGLGFRGFFLQVLRSGGLVVGSGI